MSVRGFAKYGATLIFGLVIGFWLARWWAIDGCLDRGGAWNYQYAMCELK